MGELISIILLLAVTAVCFFLFGVLAGYHSGHAAGRKEAVDEMQPSYSRLMVELAKKPNRYKDFSYSDNPEDRIFS
jgi:hypothetical protein